MSEATKIAKPAIMLVITKADVGGAQMHVLQIIQSLRTEYRFVLVTGAADFLTREAEGLGVTVEICPALVRPIRPITDAIATASLYRLLRNYQPDLVHAHSFKAGVIARLAALLGGIPCVFTAHGWSFTPGAPAFQRVVGLVVESVLCRLSRAVITISDHDFQLARKWRVGGAKQRYLVRNAATAASIHAEPATEPVNLLSVGRLTTVKNQRLMISAMSVLPEEVQLTVVGEGALRGDIEQQIRQSGMQSRVFLAGEVADIASYFADAQIFVLSSNFEGLPLSILEAMAAGLPVVATDVGGVREAVLDGETGLLVPRGDRTALVNSLAALMEDPERRKRMGRAGRQHHARYFSIGRFETEMGQIYCDLMGARISRHGGQT